MMNKIYRPSLLAVFIIIYLIINYGVYCLVYPTLNIFAGNHLANMSDTTAVADSVADTTMVYTICTDFIGDGRVFDVRGHIKTIKFYDGDEDVVNFDEQGRFVPSRFDGQDEYEITRDSKGQITYNRFFNDCKDTYYTGSFSYDTKGRVREYIATSTAAYQFSTYKYKYDENDNKISARITYSVSGEDATNMVYITEPMSFESNIKYKILEKDDRGNWTKRQVIGYEYRADQYISDEEEIDDSYVEVGYTEYNDGSQHPVYCRKQKVNRKESRILEYYD